MQGQTAGVPVLDISASQSLFYTPPPPTRNHQCNFMCLINFLAVSVVTGWDFPAVSVVTGQDFQAYLQLLAGIFWPYL
jgi:hypothetical protein